MIDSKVFRINLVCIGKVRYSVSFMLSIISLCLA
jgi:hypothetical protein